MKKFNWITFDFDGVIALHETPEFDPKLERAKIAPNCEMVLKVLVKNGWKISICSARLHPSWFKNEKELAEEVGLIEDFLIVNGIFKNKHYHEIANNKRPSVLYIDDRGYRFRDWLDIYNIYL